MVYRYTGCDFSSYKEATILRRIARRMAQLNMIDAKAAQATPVGAYYDNSFVNEIKSSGFLENVWK